MSVEEEELIKFVDDHKLYSIDELVDQIQRKKQGVKDELAIILNENYIKFIKLNEATKTNSIEYLQQKLDQMKDFFTTEHAQKQSQYKELSVLLQEKEELKKQKETIKVQALVIEKTSQIDLQLKNEIDLVALQRIAFDYSQLKFYSNSINTKPIQNEIETLKLKFIKKLEKFIKDSIINQKDLRKLLLVCEQLDQTKLFGEMFEKLLLEEFLIKLQQKEYFEFISESIGFIKKYHEMDKLYTPFCKDNGLILICFEGIATQLMDQFCQVFLVSDEFCAYYESFLQFVQVCESCMDESLQSTEYIGSNVLRSSKVYEQVSQKWQLSVYFQLKYFLLTRFNQIILEFESSLDQNPFLPEILAVPVPNNLALGTNECQFDEKEVVESFKCTSPSDKIIQTNDEDGKELGPAIITDIKGIAVEKEGSLKVKCIDDYNKIQLYATKQLQKSLEKLWETGNFPKLLPKNFKSTILRYQAFIKYHLISDIDLNSAIILLNDCFYIKSYLTTFYSQISAKNSHHRLQHIYFEIVAKIQSDEISMIICNKLIKECIKSNDYIQTIPSLYRMTQKTPSLESPFISQIFDPILKMDKAHIDILNSVFKGWQEFLVRGVVEEYASSVKKMLNSAKTISESLKRFKKKESQGESDDDRVKKQALLDLVGFENGVKNVLGNVSVEGVLELRAFIMQS